MRLHVGKPYDVLFTNWKHLIFSQFHGLFCHYFSLSWLWRHVVKPGLDSFVKHGLDSFCKTWTGLICKTWTGLICKTWTGLICKTWTGLICKTWTGLVCKTWTGLICKTWTGPLSYIIPWRSGSTELYYSGSYTCFSNRSEAKNMADFGLCWRQIHAIWYLRLQVITTDQAQFWSRLKFHTLLSFCRIMFCFLCFHDIKFCRFFRVFSMFVGRLTICLGICKFYKLFWPVKGKKTS